MKKGYKANIEQLTSENTDFRRVLYTAKYCQLVLMSLAPGEDIGLEVHADADQFFRFEKGNGLVILNESEYSVADGDCVIVPAGAKHNIINSSKTDPLKFYTLYSPPHHKDGIVRATKKEAIDNEVDFDGKTTE